MGQSVSSHGPSPSTSSHHNRRSFSNRSSSEIISLSEGSFVNTDYISELPDECLALVFQSLSSGDRNRCSVVCRRWYVVEGQSRHRLALKATADLASVVPKIFSRFDSVTKLALRCDRKSVSVDDDGLIMISLQCRGLTRLKLRGCREITELGMSAFAKNCRNLKKFSCGSCNFGAKGMNALLDNCSSLEELSVKRLRGIEGGGEAVEPIGPGAAAASLKTICLKELYNGQCFGPLISGSKKLKTLKLLRCLGDWDRILENVANRENCLVEVHLERVQVSDVGLLAVSKCSDLEILHIVKTPECTNDGLIAVAERCKYLRKLHIDGWRINRIGNEGLVAIAKHSVNLQELVLIGVNPNSASLDAIASSCSKLERLALCGSETIADGEISCIAAKCVALKKLCIKGCPVSDEGLEAFAWGCPNLVKIKVKKCRGVTYEVGDWLRAKRGSLMVSLDVCAVETVEADGVDASASDGGAQDDSTVDVEFPPIASRSNINADAEAPSSSNGRASTFKSRFGLFGGRSFVPCAFRRWSNGNSSSNGNS